MKFSFKDLFGNFDQINWRNPYSLLVWPSVSSAAFFRGRQLLNLLAENARLFKGGA